MLVPSSAREASTSRAFSAAPVWVCFAPACPASASPFTVPLMAGNRARQTSAAAWCKEDESIEPLFPSDARQRARWSKARFLAVSAGGGVCWRTHWRNVEFQYRTGFTEFVEPEALNGAQRAALALAKNWRRVRLEPTDGGGCISGRRTFPALAALGGKLSHSISCLG